ncbi:hypothetical protein Y600_6328 [Burkholderia pseudomallei MSHR3709]|nr:hypothetical protein Y600_6328 [Burkholderia pseudomallei MSHR3709]
MLANRLLRAGNSNYRAVILDRRLERPAVATPRYSPQTPQPPSTHAPHTSSKAPSHINRRRQQILEFLPGRPEFHERLHVKPDAVVAA